MHIKDRNDNIPQFAKEAYNVVIPENISIGASIARIEAVDLDSGNYGTLGIRYTGLTGKLVLCNNVEIFFKSEIKISFCVMAMEIEF